MEKPAALEWIATRAKLIAGICSAIVAVPTAAFFLYENTPRPAWQADLDAIREELPGLIDERIVAHREAASLPAQVADICSLLADMAADDPRREGLEGALDGLIAKDETGSLSC